MALYEASAGIPRTINVLCDNALIGGFAAQLKPVPVEVVDEVCRDFDLGPRAPTIPPEVAPSARDATPAVRTSSGRPPAAAISDAADVDRPSGTAPPQPKRRFSFFS
jgi:general secretion pathway protein A